MVESVQAHPVRIEGELDPTISRWLWLVKWLLAIPHYLVLALLWLAVFVLTVVAFFAILFTGRYPRGIFDFNVGVMRWSWRVAFYSYAALGTDRYPPFTLDDVPDYPARLEVAYPETLSRGLVLVKWWLLAIPHYIIVGIILGEGGYLASKTDTVAWGFQGGLLGVLVLFAGAAVLFTGRYPRGIFDLALGLDRWVARVAAYVFLMRDEYPPFRLDQGGSDAWRDQAGASEPVAATTAIAPTPATGGSTAGRVVLIVVGVVAGVIALGLLVGGGALVGLDRTQRDDDGFLMSPSREFSSPTYAVVSGTADLDTEGARWALDTFLGTVRITSDSRRDVFVGIGPAAEVDRYLEGVERDEVDDLDTSGDPEYTRRPGSAPANAPGDETFWVASTSGAGEQTLDWEPVDGDWRVALLNTDGSRGVSSELGIGAELDPVLWVGLGLLGVGLVFAVVSAIAVTAGVRRRRPG